MSVIFLVACSLFTVSALGQEPIFIKTPKNITVISGQTAILPCSVDFLGTKYKVVWQDHRGKLLTLEERRMITDERISLERPFTKEWNLHVHNVQLSDAGSYTCQINTNPVQVQDVHLHVHEPAQIIEHLSSKLSVQVREGDTVELVCNVTGVPQPTVTWYRIPQGLLQDGDTEKKQIGVEGEVLIIHNVTRYCDDTYECVAFNNVPPASSRRMRVRVEFPPEVRLPNRKLGQGRGRNTILECIVTAYPHAITVWRRHGHDIARDPKYSIEVYNEDENTLTLSLRIQTLTEEDYGEYECVSQNLMGRDSERMELYEYPKPKPAVSTTTSTARKSTAYLTPDRDKDDQHKQTISRIPDGGKDTLGEDTASGGKEGVVVQPNSKWNGFRVDTGPSGGGDRGDLQTNTRKETNVPGYNYNSARSEHVIIPPKSSAAVVCSFLAEHFWLPVMAMFALWV